LGASDVIDAGVIALSEPVHDAAAHRQIAHARRRSNKAGCDHALTP
jgi:hypothetical protein